MSTEQPRLLWHVLGWLMVAFIIVGSLVPPPTELDMIHYDKANHLLTYTLLMGWFAQLISVRKLQFAYMLGFFAMGMSLELLQAQTSYRSFELADMVANGVGIFIGWIISVTMMPGWLIKLDKFMNKKNAS